MAKSSNSYSSQSNQNSSPSFPSPLDFKFHEVLHEVRAWGSGEYLVLLLHDFMLTLDANISVCGHCYPFTLLSIQHPVTLNLSLLSILSKEYLLLRLWSQLCLTPSLLIRLYFSTSWRLETLQGNCHMTSFHSGISEHNWCTLAFPGDRTWQRTTRPLRDPAALQLLLLLQSCLSLGRLPHPLTLKVFPLLPSLPACPTWFSVSPVDFPFILDVSILAVPKL